MQNQSNVYTPAQPAAAALVQCRPLQAYLCRRGSQVVDCLSPSSTPLLSPRYFLLEDLSLMVTRHMAKMTHEEYLPRCRVPVITSPEEEQRIISTSAKVRSGEGRGRGEVSGEWVSTRGLVISTLPVVVSFIWLLRCHSRCHPAWRQAVVSAAGEVCGVSMRCGHFSVVESHMVCGMCVVLEHQTFWGGQRRIGTGARD